MIKILILTDNKKKWVDYLTSTIKFERMRENSSEIVLLNKLFGFYIRNSFPESLRGAAFAHIIEDKEIDIEDFYRLILPTIKQKVTQYGSRTILGER